MMPILSKKLRDVHLIEFFPLNEIDKALQASVKSLILNSDCILFLWESWASQQSTQFINLLDFSLKNCPFNTSIILNKVFFIKFNS